MCTSPHTKHDVQTANLRGCQQGKTKESKVQRMQNRCKRYEYQIWDPFKFCKEGHVFLAPGITVVLLNKYKCRTSEIKREITIFDLIYLQFRIKEIKN